MILYGRRQSIAAYLRGAAAFVRGLFCRGRDGFRLDDTRAHESFRGSRGHAGEGSPLCSGSLRSRHQRHSHRHKHYAYFRRRPRYPRGRAPLGAERGDGRYARHHGRGLLLRRNAAEEHRKEILRQAGPLDGPDAGLLYEALPPRVQGPHRDRTVGGGLCRGRRGEVRHRGRAV